MIERLGDERDWAEDTRPDIHIHVAHPSQPDSDPPPSTRKRHGPKTIAGALVALLMALAAVLSQLQAAGVLGK